MHLQPVLGFTALLPGHASLIRLMSRDSKSISASNNAQQAHEAQPARGNAEVCFSMRSVVAFFMMLVYLLNCKRYSTEG